MRSGDQWTTGKNELIVMDDMNNMHEKRVDFNDSDVISLIFWMPNENCLCIDEYYRYNKLYLCSRQFV